MGMSFEWFSAESTTVSHVGPGCDVRDGEPSGGENFGEWAVDDDRHALVFGADEAAVLTGTVEELRGLLLRALGALDAPGPTAADRDPVVTVTATRSAGTDAALVLMIDTYEHLEQPSRPLRILLNDTDVFTDVPYEYADDDDLRDARDVRFDVYPEQVAYFD